MSQIQNYTEFAINEGLKRSPWVVVVVKGEYITIVSKPGPYETLAGIAAGQNILRGEWVAVVRVEDIINQKNLFGIEMLR